jgi:hypothetical protein
VIQAFRLKAVRLKVGVRRFGLFSLNPFSLNTFSRVSRSRWAAAIPVLIRFLLNNSMDPGVQAEGVQAEGRISEHFSWCP